MIEPEPSNHRADVQMQATQLTQAWCVRNDAYVDKAVLFVARDFERQPNLHIAILRTEIAFDGEFEDLLSDFDMAVAQQIPTAFITFYSVPATIDVIDYGRSVIDEVLLSEPQQIYPTGTSIPEHRSQ